jgi:ubiquitin-activating enzyme E1
MALSSILIVGLNGLGVEVAKNIILAGVKSVTLYDNTMSSIQDISSNFYIHECDMNMQRSKVCARKLAELNPYVSVSALEEDLTPSVISQFSVVVLIDQSSSLQLELSQFCHQNDISLVIGSVKGVCGSVFCDFGENFVVVDNNGEQATTSMIASISNDYPALVTVLEETRHNLETGDKVRLDEIIGLNSINGCEFIVNVKDPFSFEIDFDSSSLDAYQRGGYVHQIKQPTTVNFDSLSVSIENPTFHGDVMKAHRLPILHLAFR